MNFFVFLGVFFEMKDGLTELLGTSCIQTMNRQCSSKEIVTTLRTSRVCIVFP